MGVSQYDLFAFFFNIPKVKAAEKLQHSTVLTEAVSKDRDVKNELAPQKAQVIYMQKQTLPILYLWPQTFFSLGISEFPSLQNKEFVFSGSSWNGNTNSDASWKIDMQRVHPTAFQLLEFSPRSSGCLHFSG